MLTLILFIALLTGFAQSQTEDDIELFKSWTVKHGMQIDSVDWPFDFPGFGRGVRATQDISEDQRILSVPMQLILTNSSIPEYFPFTQLLDEQRGLILVLLLEYYKGQNSFWFPYINILPKQYNTPEYWDDDELDQLHNSAFQAQVKSEQNWRRYAFSEHTRLISQVGNYPEIHFEDYLWATSVVQSRCFELNATFQHVLVPFADFLNHEPTSRTRWRMENDYFEMRLHEDVKQGQQAFNNYHGGYSNRHTLLVYGFVSHDNEANSEILEFERWEERKEGVLFYHEEPDQIRTLFASAEAPWAHTCVDVIHAELNQWPTTFDEDFAQFMKNGNSIPDNDDDERFRLALHYRLERKRIMLVTLDYCQHHVMEEEL